MRPATFSSDCSWAFLCFRILYPTANIRNADPSVARIGNLGHEVTFQVKMILISTRGQLRRPMSVLEIGVIFTFFPSEGRRKSSLPHRSFTDNLERMSSLKSSCCLFRSRSSYRVSLLSSLLGGAGSTGSAADTEDVSSHCPVTIPVWGGPGGGRTLIPPDRQALYGSVLLAGIRWPNRWVAWLVNCLMIG